MTSRLAVRAIRRHRPDSNSQPLLSEISETVTSRDELLEFFSPQPSSMPFRVPAPVAHVSTSTRTPRFFDLHLHPDLQLKQIVVLEHLPAAMAKVCDGILSLDSKHPIHLTSSAGFPRRPPVYVASSDPSHETRTNIEGKSTFPKVSEQAVVDSYRDDYANALTSIASTLIFKRVGWKSVLTWSRTPRERQPHARADGFLTFIKKEETNGELQYSMNLTKADIRRIELIERFNLHNLLLWEFKNPAAGAEPVMRRLLDSKGLFKWRNCRLGLVANPTAGDTEYSCNVHMHNTNGLYAVCGRKTGPDAKVRDVLDNAIIAGLMKGQRINLGNFKWVKPTTAGDTDGLFAPTVEPLFDFTALDSEQEEWEDEINMLQQLWAELVYNDASYVILNSGYQEILFMRDRESGTFFMSHPIPVTLNTEPTYTKYQTGLYITAYKDALDRAEQLEQLTSLPKSQWPALYQLDFVHEAYPVKLPAQIGTDVAKTKMTPKKIYELLIDDLTNKSVLRIRAPSKYNNLCTYQLCSKVSQSPSEGKGPNLASSQESEWSLDAHKSYTGRVYSIVATKDSYSLSKLVIKFATTEDQFSILQKEHELHELQKTLRPPTSHIKCFGIFKFPGDVPLWAMIMEDGGKSFDILLESQPRYFQNHKSLALIGLQALHEIRFTHGNLDKSHILMNDKGKVSWISYRSFERNEQLGEQGSPAKENHLQSRQKVLILQEKRNLITWLESEPSKKRKRVKLPITPSS